MIPYKDGKSRCVWANPKNERYIRYHDEEWGQPVHEDAKLFEMLLLESFQAGLSWECVLNKREAFAEAFDQFDPEKISRYGADQVEELMLNEGIIRNRRKITAVIKNARIFLEIQKEYGTFSDYLWGFSNHEVCYETGKTTSALSDTVSADLYKRGMRFVGSTIIYSYLQAVGILYSHEEGCFLCRLAAGGRFSDAPNCSES